MLTMTVLFLVGAVSAGMTAGVVQPTSLATKLLNETAISLSAAAKMFPPLRENRPVTTAGVWRWITQGIRAAGGVLKLEAVKVGGHWMTSREAVARFIDRQNPQSGSGVTEPTSVCGPDGMSEPKGVTEQNAVNKMLGLG